MLEGATQCLRMPPNKPHIIGNASDNLPSSNIVIPLGERVLTICASGRPRRDLFCIVYSSSGFGGG